MANRITRGNALAGNFSSDIGFSAFAIGSGLLITPNSSILPGSELDTTYTTGLTALGIKVDDFVIFNPVTSLASGISYNAKGAASGIAVHWVNVAATAVTINPTNWNVFVIKRTTKV